MADDGMLINFDLGDGPLSVKRTFKGGKWKDRLSAKKAAQYNRNKAAKAAARLLESKSRPDSSVESKSVNPEPPVKKPRLDGEEDLRQPASSLGNVRPNVRTNRHDTIAPRQIVSSLFTFNPSSQTKASLPGNEEKAEPSNAPLKSELDTFTSLGLSTHLAEHLLTKLDIKAPTAIQRTAISQLVAADADAFLQAETGSGKTLAYLLPIVQKIVTLSSADSSAKEHTVQRDSGLFAIIIAPTRELSKQISVVLESLLRCAHWIVSGIVVGGEKKKSEKARLRKGLNILIATPGRLADHLDHTEVLDVSSVRWLVLDEGDRLMELGFEQDLQKIISKLNFRGAKQAPQVPGLPIRRTTILCSATMKPNVQRLGEMSLKDAIRIQAGPDGNTTANANVDSDQSFTAPAQLQQTYAIIPAKQRLVALTAVLRHAFARDNNTNTKAIVFLSSADSVDFHFEVFTQVLNPSPPTTQARDTVAPSTPLLAPSTANLKLQIHRLHGSLPQATRSNTLLSFRNTTSPALLLTTDLSSRGLDLPTLNLIIEYDPAADVATHLHRAGRTARAGRAGESLVFLLPGPEEGYVTALHRAHSGRVRATSADRILEQGFSKSPLGAAAAAAAASASGAAAGTPASQRSTTLPKSKTAEPAWQAHATAAQLAIEQHVLSRARAGTLARAAFRAHVRAYATHVAAERGWFELRALHLGHLAKAFGLRERPGGLGMGEVGLGRAKAKAAARRGVRRGGVEKGGEAENEEERGGEREGEVDLRAAARAMRARARAVGGAGAEEFNVV